MSESSIHRQAWDQIPWIVNGSLPQSDRPAIEAHLEGCADCRDELEFQRRLASAIDTSSQASGQEIGDPQMSWQQLRGRIESAGGSKRLARNQRGPRVSQAWIPWLAAAMVVQAVGLGVLGTVVWSRSGSPSGAVYRTLSATEPAAAAATIRVVFAPDMSVGHMQALLAASGLQVQSGPSNAGVWSLEPAPDSSRSATASALKELRGSSEVRFAEAIGISP
jgi:hypothetical protein